MSRFNLHRKIDELSDMLAYHYRAVKKQKTINPKRVR